MARYNVINNQMAWQNVHVETENRVRFSISRAFKTVVQTPTDVKLPVSAMYSYKQSGLSIQHDCDM